MLFTCLKVHTTRCPRRHTRLYTKAGKLSRATADNDDADAQKVKVNETTMD